MVMESKIETTIVHRGDIKEIYYTVGIGVLSLRPTSCPEIEKPCSHQSLWHHDSPGVRRFPMRQPNIIQAFNNRTHQRDINPKP